MKDTRRFLKSLVWVATLDENHINLYSTYVHWQAYIIIPGDTTTREVWLGHMDLYTSQASATLNLKSPGDESSWGNM